MEANGGTHTLLTDEILTAQTLRGEVSAFEKLVDRYKKSVFAIIYRMTGQYQEAEDIAQEVFITVYQKLYQFDSSKKFAPWIHRIAINTCISSLRKNNKVISLNFDETFTKQYESEPLHNYGNPESALERNELKTEIRAALLELPESYQSVLILRYQLDLNNREIAETLGVSKENVEVKVHRARKALRKIIIRRWEERGEIYELPGY
ncbi:MAG: sigma-70 family RNA polymerase sigma factor [Syntrophomonas sp.]|nr:sigma-70 family RNA polymerase sigma factor [Syntrophomonas sp.]